MAKKKRNGFDTSALEKYAERLDAAGGSEAIKRAVTAGMIATKQEINKTVTAAMAKSNLPAKGKYSTGDTLESLDKSASVRWSGNIASTPLGFDMSQSGITSVLLMNGTPKMAPVNGLKKALKGDTARRTAKEKQEEAMAKVLQRLGG